MATTPKTIDSKIDGLVHLVPTSPGEGFFTRVARSLQEDEKREEIMFRVGRERDPIDETEPRAPARFHQVETVRSLAALTKRYGATDRSVIFVARGGSIVAVLDDTIERGKRELVVCRLMPSDDFAMWSNVQNAPCEHRGFLQFLMRQEHNLVDPAIIAAIREVKTTASVDHESDLRYEGETVGVKFVSKGNEALVKFPRKFDIRLPILDIDVGRDPAEWGALEMRVEVVMPRQANQGVSFILINSRMGEAFRARVSAEAAVMREALGEDWLIVYGEPKYEERSYLRGKPGAC